MEEFVTIKEASQRTGIPEMALYQRVHRGSIASKKVNTKRILVDISDIISNDTPPNGYISIEEAAEKYGITKLGLISAIIRNEIPMVYAKARNSYRKTAYIPDDLDLKFRTTKNPEYKKEKVSTNYTSFCTNPELLARIYKCVNDTGISRSDLIRAAIDSYLKERGY